MESIEYTGTTFLRLASLLSALLKTDFGGDRILGAVEPLEQCSPPVVPQVCQEFRKHIIKLISHHVAL